MFAYLYIFRCYYKFSLSIYNQDPWYIICYCLIFLLYYLLYNIYQISIVCLFTDIFKYIYNLSWIIHRWYSLLDFCMFFSYLFFGVMEQLYTTISVILFAGYFIYLYKVSRIITDIVQCWFHLDCLIFYVMVWWIICTWNLFVFKLTNGFRYLYKVLCRIFSQ